MIHRDLPPTVESYLQESGRAGRDGQPAQAIVLARPRAMAGPTHAGTREPVDPGADRASPESAGSPGAGAGARAGAGTNPVNETATSWSGFLSGDRCRRAVLVEALGAHLEVCPGCDVCEGGARRESPVAEAVARWLRRRRRRYTPGQAEAVLAGTAREPVYGLLDAWRREEIEEAIAELKADRRLRVIRRGPWRGQMA